MLHEKLAQGAEGFADRPCIIEAETGRALTYGECAAAVRAMRRALGDAPRAIAMTLPGGIPSAVLWLAALTGGHLLVPCAPDAGAAERARMTRRHRPDVLVVERAEDAAGFGCPDAHVLTRAECERLIERGVASIAMGEGGPDADLPPREGRVYLTTSGSTGEPKGVLLTERQVALTAGHIRDAHRLAPADRGLTVLPFSHVNAPVVSLCASLMAGGTVVVARRFSRRRFWQWIEEYGITWASVVPTVLALLLETERPDFLPGALRFVRSASAPLPVAHLLAFERRFGVSVVETYGLSEAAATVAANPVPPGLHKPGAVGLPVGVALRVCVPRKGVAKDGAAEPLRDVAPGEEGEVCIAGPSVIEAYDGDAEPTAFVDGWFRTGDLGHLDEDGYLYITGRLRDVINRGGENIAPREIEEVLLADALVRDAAVVGRPDPLYGQQVVAYVVPRGAWGAEQEAALRARCAELLSAYKVPQAFVAARTLPRTRSGKIQRHRLPAGLAGTSMRGALARVGVASRSLGRMAGAMAGAALSTATAARPANALAAQATSGQVRDTSQAGEGGKARPRPYLHELDMIRTVTALSVVGVHVLTFSLLFQGSGLGQQVQLGLGSALHFTREVFMFTTAFVLVYSYAGKPFSARAFWRKRGVGVVVPYVAWSLIYLWLAWLNQPPASPRDAAVATLRAVVTGSASYQLYYILLAIQFYALFPLLLPLIPLLRRHARPILIASGLLELAVMALDYTYLQNDAMLATPLGTRLGFYQDRFVLLYQFYFILGAIAALYLDQARAFARRHGLAIAIVMGATLAGYCAYVGFDTWALGDDIDHATAVLQPIMVPYSLAVIAFLGWLASRWAGRVDASGRPRGARAWRTLADASFGIYLVHPLFITIAMKYVAPAVPGWMPATIGVALVWAFAVAAAATLSVLLMGDPWLSRLVGRAAPKAPARGIAGAIAPLAGIAPVAASAPSRASTGGAAPALVSLAGGGALTLAMERAGREAAERSYTTIILRAVAPRRERDDVGGPDALDVLAETSGARDARVLRRRRARELRRQGWKQKDIAAELGVSPSTVSQWFRREREGDAAFEVGRGLGRRMGDSTGEREVVLAGR